jgi:hypothetical protein
MTARSTRLAESRIADIRQGGSCTLDEHRMLVDMAQEAILMRRALEFIASDEKMTIEHQRGFALGTLQGLDAMADGRKAGR